MFELWIPIGDIPADGREFTFTDQAPWHEAWKEFSLSVTPGKDLKTEATILLQPEDGALIRGTLKGSVNVTCDRCATPYEFDFDINFDAFAQLPTEDVDEEPRVRKENNELQLNIGAVLWEEFALALPVKPLCSNECKGVCSGCGKDLNSQECECEREEGDERLAVFRNLKIK